MSIYQVGNTTIVLPDDVEVENGAATVTPAAYPCPGCGRESKEHQDGSRICSSCRKVFRWEAGTEAEGRAKSQELVRQAQSRIKSVDSVEAGLAPYVPPAAPCPKCGKESKEHHDGARICSDRACRYAFKPLAPN